MKKIILLSSIVTVLMSCGSSGNGELVGVQQREFFNPTDPYGMVFIPQGSFVMGPSDQDVPFANVSAAKRVSVGAFYMDETEITNNEYRQFTSYVRDSLAHLLLGEAGIEGHLIEEDEYGNFLDPARINWKTKIRWDEQEVREILEDEMYLSTNERYNSLREFDTRKFMYEYQVLDLQDASNKSNREGNASGKRDRSEFLSTVSVNIYPDTLAWMHDYAYSFNEPYTNDYYSHTAYDDYPVVGVSWKQAIAFTKWRTQQMNKFLRANKLQASPDFRLPTESEWEIAASGMEIKGNFQSKGLLQAEPADGVLSSFPEQLFGDVWEWTQSSYSPYPGYKPVSGAAGEYNGKFMSSQMVLRGGSCVTPVGHVRSTYRNFFYPHMRWQFSGLRLADNI